MKLLFCDDKRQQVQFANKWPLAQGFRFSPPSKTFSSLCDVMYCFLFVPMLPTWASCSTQLLTRKVTVADLIRFQTVFLYFENDPNALMICDVYKLTALIKA